MIYTVILDYNDGEGNTYMTSVDAADPQEAGDEARRELADQELVRDDDDEEDYDSLILEKAMGYKVIAVLEGDHEDVYPHNQ